MNTDSKAKHTPGPWQFETSDKHIVGAEKCLSIAEISNIDAGGATGFYFGDESKANARLIAAAPELLEALQKMLNDNSFYFPEGNPWGDAARAAIAKALGENNGK